MKLGIIGLGARAAVYSNRLISNPEFKEHTVVATCDIDETRLEYFTNAHFGKQEKLPTKYLDWKDLLDDPEVEGILITTPDHAHMEIALAAMEKGLPMILEKPIEAAPERAVEIYKAGKDYDKTLALGFVLRYTNFYEKIKEIIDSGELGELVTLTASENLDKTHSSSYFRRWHRFGKFSGGMMNTKCCHDIDILRFVTGGEMKSIVAFGSNSFYVPEAKKDAAEHCKDCNYKDECIYSFNYRNYESPYRWNCEEDLCIYNCEKDVFDRHTMIIEYESGLLANFELVMFSGAETRLITIHGTKATLEGDFTEMTIKITPLDKTKEITTIKLPPATSGHGGGDDHLLHEFFDSASGKSETINHSYDGFVATLAALAADISARERRIVSMDEFK